MTPTTQTNWDYYEEYYEGDERRLEPARQSLQRRLTTATRRTSARTRNLLASNIGLIAKRGPKGKLLVVGHGARLRHSR